METCNYAKLVERALRKEEEAFVELYNATSSLSFYITRQICNNSEDAMDIVQNSYIKAFSNLDKLKKPESFPKWLARIVANQTKDYLKKNYKVKFENIDESTGLDEIDSRFTYYYEDVQPELVVDKEETRMIIQEILDTLSVEQRMVIMMYYFEEMSIREIATNLNCNVNTVKSRLLYAKRKIEELVHGLEIQGTKLHGLLPIPFFTLLLKQGVEAYKLPTYITEEVLHNVSKSIAKGGLLGMAKINISQILKPFYVKVIAGVLAGSLVIGGGYLLFKESKVPIDDMTQIASIKETETESEGIEERESVKSSEVVDSETETEKTKKEKKETSAPETNATENTTTAQQETTAAPVAAENFAGEWNRTNIPRANSATITVSNQTDSSFDFSFNGIYGGNSGSISGTAIIVGKNIAEFEYTPTYDSSLYAKIEFVIGENSLQVSLADGSNNALGFGHNVSIDGEYITNSPVYLDTGIVDEIMPSDELKERVRALLEQNVYDQMVFVLEHGIRYQVEGLTYSGFISGAGQGVDLLISNDMIYCLGYGLDADGMVYKFYTNDAAYQSQIPSFMPIDKGEIDIEFIYRP